MQLTTPPPPPTGFAVHFPLLTGLSATASALATATARWQSATDTDNDSLERSHRRLAATIAMLHDADTALSGALHAAAFLD